MNHARRGFTMIELLVVIGLIGFLAVALVVAVGPLLGGAKAKATGATILKIDELLAKRREAFQRTMDRTFRQDPNYPILLKDESRKQFPQRFLELCGFDGAPGGAGTDDDGNGVTDRDGSGNLDIAEIGWPGSDDVGTSLGTGRIGVLSSLVARVLYDQLKANPDRGTAYKQHATNPATESAEVLALLILHARGFGIEAVDSDAFNSRELADTDGDGLMEFIDGWGNPLRFYRWPTRLIRPAWPPASASTSQSVNNPAALTRSYTHKIRTGAQADGNPTPAQLLMGALPPPSPTAGGDSRGDNAQIQYELQDPLARDADDPRGQLQPNSSGMIGSLTVADFENAYHTPDTYHVMLVVSAGADERLGLYEPHDFANRGHLAQPIMSDLEFPSLTDNVTNLNIRAGAQ